MMNERSISLITRMVSILSSMLLSNVAFAAEESVNIPIGQRQLSLDDNAVGKIENLKRSHH